MFKKLFVASTKKRSIEIEIAFEFDSNMEHFITYFLHSSSRRILKQILIQFQFFLC